MVAQISDTKPYVGEGIYVEYRLYVSDNISVNNFAVTNSPQYNGFWNQDIEVRSQQVLKGEYRGESYRYLILKRAVLIPQKSGKLVVDPIEMDVSVGVPTGRGDWFGNMITRDFVQKFSSGKRTIEVKQLPLLGKPEDFSGAVGTFDFSVIPNKTSLKANESAEITVKVTGTGNLKLFDLPKIATPSDLEVYTPEHQDKARTTLKGIKGEVSDKYIVVPEFKGKYKIPQVQFSYFDPKIESYQTITSKEIILDVMEGRTNPDATIATNSSGKNESNYCSKKSISFYSNTNIFSTETSQRVF